MPGLNAVFRVLAMAPALAAPVLRAMRLSTWVARTFGSAAGGMLAEIEEASGTVTQARVFAPRRSYLAAVAPAVLAVGAIASGRFPERALVPHDRHVDPDELLAYLRRLGIECAISGPQIQDSPSVPGEAGKPDP